MAQLGATLHQWAAGGPTSMDRTAEQSCSLREFGVMVAVAEVAPPHFVQEEGDWADSRSEHLDGSTREPAHGLSAETRPVTNTAGAVAFARQEPTPAWASDSQEELPGPHWAKHAAPLTAARAGRISGSQSSDESVSPSMHSAAAALAPTPFSSRSLSSASKREESACREVEGAGAGTITWPRTATSAMKARRSARLTMPRKS